jgi:hypothetical protein
MTEYFIERARYAALLLNRYALFRLFVWVYDQLATAEQTKFLELVNHEIGKAEDHRKGERRK